MINMTQITEQAIITRFSDHLSSHSRHLAAMQAGIMDARLHQMNDLAGQIGRMLVPPADRIRSAKTISLGRDWLEEFATGEITNCLGPEFLIYNGRRCPRIPNGDLMLISRVRDIQGERGVFDRPAKIQAEFDVQPDAWFYSHPSESTIPLSILMEIALQPCGVLSAWLHTQLRHPDIDFLFRNLDGSITQIKPLDVRGKTITTHATLEKTVFSGKTIIQEFSYRLSCGDEEFVAGHTTFGYFPEETMKSQVGLDGGHRSLPQGQQQNNYERLPRSIDDDLSVHKLNLIDGIRVSQMSITESKGNIQAWRSNTPSDWFYVNHFLGDPVMPGSLGVEMIFQAFRSGISHFSGLPGKVHVTTGNEMTWKYRGQVLPSNSRTDVEIRINEIADLPAAMTFNASASLWVDGLRIYEIQNIALTQQK